MPEPAYYIDDDGFLIFRESGHRYGLTRFARGHPLITVEDKDGAVIQSDRFDILSNKERRRFAGQLNGVANTVADELLRVSVEFQRMPPPAAVVSGESGYDGPYACTPAGLIWHKPTQSGTIPTPLTNFAATIASDVVEDDGMESRRVFEIEATLNGRPYRFAVPAERFAGMGWATEHMGAGALVYPGIAAKDHARAAMQLLSAGVEEQRVYAHLGWRQHGEEQVYLHNGGAIGAAGVVDGAAVHLPPSLTDFQFPAPVEGTALIAAIRASLAFWDVAPLEITVPSYAAIWRAVLAPSDFSLHLAGPTGEGKSEVAARVQQHWGPSLDARHLPGSWSSTGNALEGLTFAAKDTIVVVDDFAPGGSAHDIARYHREADRVFRAQGNRSGRLRMRADATLRAAKPPRGTVFSTGEDVPRGQSVRGRMLTLELAPGSLRWDRMTAAQQEGACGLYAQALVGFVRWCAPQYDQLLDQLRTDTARYRDLALRAAQHRRTPDIVAHPAAGFGLFLAYAQAVGALDQAHCDALWETSWTALGGVASAQSQYQTASEPTQQFLSLVRGALVSGDAHFAGESGGEPDHPNRWGWRSVVIGSGLNERREWQSRGRQIGWIAGDNAYLEPEASYIAAQEFARRGGDAIAVTSQTLRKRLRERNLLASIDEARQTLTVRKVLEETQRNVLHLLAITLAPSPREEPDKPDIAPPPAQRMSEKLDPMSGSAGQPDSESPDGYERFDQNVGFVGFSPGESGRGDARGTVSGHAENPTADPTPQNGKPDSRIAKERVTI